MRPAHSGADRPAEPVRPARQPLRVAYPDLGPQAPPEHHPSEWEEWADEWVYELGPDVPDVDPDRERWEPGAELPLFPDEGREHGRLQR